MIDVGDLILTLGLDSSGFLKSMNDIKNQVSSAAKDIERITFKVGADDSLLKNLNTHIESKRSHIKDVQSWMNSNPIKPKVDDSGVTNLNKQIETLKQNQNIQVTATLNTNANSIQPQIKLDTSDLENSLNDIQSTIEKATKKNLAADTLLAPLKAIGGGISKVLEGALFSIGMPLGNEVGQGIKEGIGKESSSIIGSFRLISREIAGGLTQEIVNSLGTDAAKIQNVVEGIVGKTALTIEGAAVRGQVSDIEGQQQERGAQQISKEYQSLVGRREETTARKIDLQSQRSDLTARAEQLNKEIEEYQVKLGLPELEKQVQAVIQEMQAVASNTPATPEEAASLQQKGKELSQQFSQLTEKVRDISNKAVAQFGSQINEIKAINEELTAAEQQFNRDVAPLEQIDAIKAIRPNGFGVARAAAGSQPEYYQQVFKQVVSQTAAMDPSFDPTRPVMPELVTNPRLKNGVYGQYDKELNQVQVSPEAYEAIQSGNLNLKQIETLSHELRHSLQFDSGRVDAESMETTPGINLMRPTSQQMKELGSSIERSTANAATPETEERIRALEADAYAFADKVKTAIAESVNKSFATSNFENTLGIGGGKAVLAISTAQQQALVKLKAVIKLTDEYGVDVQQELSAAFKNIQSAGDAIAPLIEKASNIQILSPEEIRDLSNELVLTYTQSIESINQELASFKQIAVQKVQQSQQQQAQPQQTMEEFKAGLDEQYTAQGLRQVAGKLGYANTNKLKKDDLIELISGSNRDDVDNIIANLGDSIKKKAFQSEQQVTLPTINETEIAEQLKSANQRLQQMLKELAITTEESRQAIIEQIVIETNQQIAQIDQIVQQNSLSGLTAQKLSGYRSYFEQVRQPLAAEMVTNNAAQANQIAQQGQQGTTLAAFGDIREEVAKMFENFFSGGAGTNNIDPEEMFYRASASATKHLGKFERAESAINERYNNAVSAGTDIDIEGQSETTLGRIGRVFKSQLGGDLVSGLGRVTEGVAALTSAFFALQGIQFVLQMFDQFKDALISTAIEFESLQTRINSASGGAAEGMKNMAFLRSQAKDLGLDLKSNIEGGAGILAATQNTSLEGPGARQIIKAAGEAATVNDLNASQQSRELQIFQQMIAQGSIQVGQIDELSQVLPGANNTIARALGVTPQQLRKLTQSGALDPEQYFPAISTQFRSDSAAGLGTSLDTSQSTLNRYNNSVVQLQESLGKMILPSQNFSLNVLSTALEALSKALPQVMALLTTLAAYLTKPLWEPFIDGILKANLSMGTFANGASTAFPAIANAAKGALTAIAPFASFLLTLQALSDQLGKLKDNFSDLSGEFRKSADSASKSFDDFNKSLAKVQGSNAETRSNRPTNRFESYTKDLMEDPASTILGGTFIGPWLGLKNRGREEKVAIDTINAIKDEYKTTESVLSRSGDADLQSQVKKVQGLDNQLSAIQAKRRALIQLNPQDAAGLRALDEQQSSLLQQRETESKPTADYQQQLSARVDFLKNALSKMEELRASDPNRTQGQDDRYAQNITKLKDELAKAQKVQDDFNKSIGQSITAFQLLQRSIEEVAARLGDANDKATIQANQAKSRLSVGVASGTVTPGQQQYQSRQIELSTLQQQLANQIAARNQTRGLLLADRNTQDVMAAYNVNENTGRNTLKAYAGQATRQQDKYVLEQLASVQDQNLNISNLQTQIAQSKADAYNQMVSLTKQVADYYRGIQRTAEEQAIAIQKTALQIDVTQQQTKIQKILSDGYDTITSQFLDGLSQIYAQASPEDVNLDAQSKLLQNKNQLQDTLKSGVELQRQLPGDLPKIPVELDFGSIKDDNTIADLSSQVQDAVGNTQDLGKEIANVQSSFDDSTNSADGLKSGIDNVTQSTGDTLKELDKVTLGIDNSNSTAKELEKQFVNVNSQLGDGSSKSQDWNNQLGATHKTLGGIEGFFQSILGWIDQAIAKTKEWLKNIGQAALNGGQLMGQAPEAFRGDDQVAGGSVAQGSYNIATNLSPSAQSPNQVAVHHWADNKNYHQEMFEGRMETFRGDGGIDRLVKDLVLSKNGNINVPVPSPAMGTARVLSDPSGYGSHEVEVLNQQGEVISRVGHMQSAFVKTGDQVSYGQSLGIQGSEGHAPGGVHAHIEMPRELWDKYFTDLKSGGFQTTQAVCAVCGGNSHTTQQHTQAGNKLYGNLQEQVMIPKDVRQMRGFHPNANMVDPRGAVGMKFSGEASWYGDAKSDPLNTPGTATNEHYDENGLTAASPMRNGKPVIPMNSMVRVTNRENGRTVVVRVNDTGAFGSKAYGNRVLDLSKGAARELGMLQNGKDLAQIDAEVLGMGKKGQPGVSYAQLQNASVRGQAIAPSALQPLTTNAMGLATNTSQQQAAQIEDERVANVGKKQADYVRNYDKLLRQYEKNFRDLEDQSRTSAREVEDSSYSILKNPTPTQKFNQEVVGINRRFDDQIRARQRDINFTLNPNITQTQEALTSNAQPISDDDRKRLQQRLETFQKKKAQDEAEIKALTEQRGTANSEAKTLFDREEMIRQRTAGFSLQSEDISTQQARSQLYKTVLQQSPRDERTGAIPGLERDIALKQADYELDKARAEIQDRLYKHEINQGQAGKEIANAEKRNILEQEYIELVYKRADADEKARRAKILLDVNSELTGVRSQNLQTQIQGRGLYIGSGDPIEMQRRASLIEQEASYKQTQFDTREKIRTNKLTPDEGRTEILEQRLLNEQKLRNIQAQYAKSTEEQQFGIKQRVSQSDADLATAQASSLRGRGFETQAKEVEKRSAIAQQEFSYESQLRDIDNLAKSTNIAADKVQYLKDNLKALNDIKLQNIKDQFDPWTQQLTNFQKSFGDALSGVISGTSSIEDAFKSMVSSIASSLAQAASSMITNQLFANFGGKSKKSDESGGFGSLLGSLFGGGGGGGDSGGGLDLGGISSLFSLFGMAEGGRVGIDGFKIPVFADGGGLSDAVSQAFAKERSMSGREPVLIVANKDEMILNHQQAQRYQQLGLDKIVNRQVPNFATGGIVGGGGASGALDLGNTMNVDVGDIHVHTGGDAGDGKGDKSHGNKLGATVKSLIVSTLIQESKPKGVLHEMFVRKN